jgi:hypothetical protein
MKTKILRTAFVSVFVLEGLAMLLASSTRDGRGFVAVGDPLPANIIVVTNTNDSGPGSLRNALAVAHNGDTIDATGVSGTILLTSGALQFNSFTNNNVRIIGPGAGNLAVNGNATSSVFENFASDVTISGFTITNGKGVGIINHGGLTLSMSSVVRNAGVGIYNFAQPLIHTPASLTITNCTVSGNSGGGISNNGSAFGTGGGGAELTVSNCTISGNSASNGGGIYNATSGSLAIAAVSNSTLSGNSAAGDGGAIYNNAAHVVFSHFVVASVSVSNCTISGNSAAGHGGGIYNINAGGSAFLELGSTILKAGSSGENIFNNGGTVTSLGYNLASDNGGGFLTGPGDQINTDPMLGPLQDNGGPTFTHALLTGSPAIDAGNPSFTPPPLYDQRGPSFWRVRNGLIDVGSFEVQAGATPPRATPTPRPRPTPRSRD